LLSVIARLRCNETYRKIDVRIRVADDDVLASMSGIWNYQIENHASTMFDKWKK
jgi:hypothetical protein